MKIRPDEIEVPQKDPFKNDLLSRKKPAELLTKLLGSIEGPCVLAVDGAWGAGKSTFLRLWSRYLRNEKFPVVEFNAWETDHVGNPLVALSAELTEGLGEYHDHSLVEKTKEAVKRLLRAVPVVIRIVTAGVLDVQPLIEKEAGGILSSYAEDGLAKYQEARHSIGRFRDVLQDMADKLFERQGDRPLIVMIDELDRCRPTYAVELLEIAKHLFSVKHIVFVLAVNRSQLIHSVKALYGNDFDAEGYLRRFFDLDFRLPEPDREAFIDAMLDKVQLEENVRGLLQVFFSISDLSLRRIAQAIYRGRLMFASLNGDRQTFSLMAGVALILRTIDPALYLRFVRGRASDLEVVDTVFARAGIEDTERQHVHRVFERAVIMAYLEVSMARTDWQEDQQMTSPLLERYRNNTNSDIDIHAQSVLGPVDGWTGGGKNTPIIPALNSAIRLT